MTTIIPQSVEEGDGGRNISINKSSRETVPDAGIDIGTACNTGGIATDRATAPHMANAASLFCILICNIGYFPFWFCGLDLGSDCFSSRSLHTFYFSLLI